MEWTRKKLIKSYIDFFKKNGHKEIPNVSLVPGNDPTVLFTTAGMHPLVPYLLGQKHPLGKRLVNVQKCIRTGDIDEVGDTTHHTFFEMLGNWSLGDYWKEEAIKMTFEFHTKILKIPLERYAVSCFEGNEDAEKDVESSKIWEKTGVPRERIAFLGKKDNWWGPAGDTGPCGPDTEQFYWALESKPPKNFDTENKGWVEIGNDVLMQYIKDQNGNFIEAEQQNVDFGGGVERTLALLNGIDDNYKTEVFLPIIKKIEEISGKKYGDQSYKPKMRIIADHIKASVFIIADNVTPANTEQGYVLRRLIRRAIRYGRELGMKNFTKEIAEPVFKIYDDYEHLKEKKKTILSELEKEEERFMQTIEKGMKVFEKISNDKLSGKSAFLLYQSYGFPIEMTEELAKQKGMKVDMKEFQQELVKHQELSKTASAGRFKSGLADNSEQTTKLHTATHLLNEALREVLDRGIAQKGSNITPERLRFDFNFDRKLTTEEIKKVEEIVNKKISEGLEVTKEELPLRKALSLGFQGEFGAKYPDVVSVYTIGKDKKPFSKEICTGPHVNNTKEIGKFKITKEESSSAGIRRIKATLE